MNFLCETLRPIAVWVLAQWLGYRWRCAVVSESVAPEIATVKRFRLAPVGRSRYA